MATGFQIRKSAPVARIEQWNPPTGWTYTGGGVWIPNDYKPTRWELPTPRVRNLDDARREWVKCKKSLAYFALMYVWTLDTDDPIGVSVRKFPAYPYLRRFFQAVQRPQNTHSEKSRQMLLTWAWMAVLFWDVLFHKNYADLVLSKRSTDVDDGGANSTPNSNLGKVRFMYERLPEHLWQPFEFKKFIVRVPTNDAYIRGETGKGGKASRGSTWKRALMDEAAYVDHSETVFSGLRQAAKQGTILNSTPNGTGNTFYRIRFSKTSTFLKLSFHWSAHPRKAIGLYCICGWKATPGGGMTPRDQFLAHAPDCPRTKLDPPRSPEMRSPWYDKEAADLTADKVASELDISYQGSRSGRVYTGFDQIRNVWQIFHKLGPRRIDETDAEYRTRYLLMAIDPRFACFTTMDIGVGDPTALILGQILDDAIPRVRFLDVIEESDKGYDFYASVIQTAWYPAMQQVGIQTTMRHYGGRDVKNRDSKLESWWTNLRAAGIHVEYKGEGDNNEQGSLLDWVDYVNDFGYRKGNIEISEWCSELIDAVDNYHYPVDDTGKPLPGIHLPVHDEWSHINDAIRYLYSVRYQDRLVDRSRKGIETKRILRRGSAYDRRTETRKF